MTSQTTVSRNEAIRMLIDLVDGDEVTLVKYIYTFEWVDGKGNPLFIDIIAFNKRHARRLFTSIYGEQRYSIRN